MQSAAATLFSLSTLSVRLPSLSLSLLTKLQRHRYASRASQNEDFALVLLLVSIGLPHVWSESRLFVLLRNVDDPLHRIGLRR